MYVHKSKHFLDMILWLSTFLKLVALYDLDSIEQKLTVIFALKTNKIQFKLVVDVVPKIILTAW